MANEESHSGLGDIIFGPFIFLYENQKANVYLSFWEFVQAPTGQYDRNTPDTNIGYDAWWFEHELAFGWYPGKFGIDANLNYWQRLESRKLNIDYPDALEFETVVHYGITKKFRVGINFAGWWDLDDLEIDNVTIPDSKGTNYKLGLNLGYNLSKHIILNLRTMFDVKSDNYTKGWWTYLRVLYLF